MEVRVMHALLVSVSIPRENLDAATKDLHERVVPLVKQTPGFVAGYWLDPKDTGGSGLEGFGFIVYQSETDAKNAQTMASQSPQGAGATFTNFEIREVVAHA
jgi:hypothetical protein